MQRGIDGMRDGYAAVIARIARRVVLTLGLVAVAAMLTGYFGSQVPSGFLPDEDQGAFFVEVLRGGVGTSSQANAPAAPPPLTIPSPPRWCGL
ncbi:hypothetical protein C8P66_1571 [Humitalea rosea]|uniref:AcrB/AcrD/AcrF family protein n=2 Tax=Humitalea rosea TaxID=990373 RepID=A0A2W7HTH9_9PROT|nr:hypothetical protein C8P66_1571 [Humitalea rosea]